MCLNYNQALSIIIGGTNNDRKAMIQVGHSSSGYAQYLGSLALNPLGGNVGIGTTSPGAKLHVNGSAIADAFYYSSDKSLKRDIRVLDNNLEKVLELEGVSFNWKENGEASIGLIAQDVEKIFPEAVNENPETGMKSINYGVLVSPLIEAVKEQQGQIELLENRLEKLEGNIKALKVFLNNSEI
jgi:hypothetical protein